MEDEQNVSEVQEVPAEVPAEAVNAAETQLQEEIKISKSRVKKIDTEEAMKDIQAGMTVHDLAKKYNCKYPAFYNYGHLNAALKARKVAQNQALIAKMKVMFSNGMSQKEVASAVKLSVITVRRYMNLEPSRKRKPKASETLPTNIKDERVNEDAGTTTTDTTETSQQ